MSDSIDNSPLPEPPPSPAQEEHPEGHQQTLVVIANRHAALERKHRARRNLFFIIAGIAAAGGAVWIFLQFSSVPLEKIASFEAQVTNDVSQVQTMFPSPLKATSRPAASKSTDLSISGIVADTNAARANASSEPPLAENVTLDAIATLRLDDMFANQYFAHVNPSTGESALTVASSVGYNHLALGENLAEGIFAGDQGVVDAWMNSPGHRANILDSHYTQIGVAVRKGNFQGQTSWIAVQVFGKPTSACPKAPDPILQKAIDAAEQALGDMSQELTQEQASISAMQPQSGEAYNSAVAQYNSLVTQYNSLAAQTKAEVAQYNAQVEAFNACL